MQQPTEDWWRALEAERHDQTWRTPKEPARPICARDHAIPKNEAKLWFHAGRYAEGARDADARQGNRYAKMRAKNQ